MSILIVGHTGYLGSYLKEHLNCDILATREIKSNGKEYEYVINCIGKPNLEYCEANKEETEYSNCNVLLDIHREFQNAKIINFSSYYVYDYEGTCKEDSPVTEKYNYCRQKLSSEKLTTEFGGVSFRIGKLFGHLDIDKQNKLTEYIIKNDKITLDRCFFNPTSLSQVLDVVRWELENKTLNGVYNLSNFGFISHYVWGLYVDFYLNTKKNITQIEKLNRNFDNYGKFRMDVNKLHKIIPLRTWEEDLVSYLKEIKTSRILETPKLS